MGRRALPNATKITADRGAKICANAFSTHLNFPDILEQPMIDPQPVYEDVVDEDIADETVPFDNSYRNVQMRTMSPSETTFTSVTQERTDFDQDYDQYSLHMSAFQAYNTTHEELPHDLGLLEHEDVIDLNIVENYWERHPDAYSNDLPTANSPDGNEFPPDVEDA
jgi:hypothetical protein